MALHLEHDSLATAEGVKQLLTIRLQLCLVVGINQKLLPRQNIGDIVLLRIVRDKPVNQTQGNVRGALQQLHDLLLVFAGRIELLQATDNQLLLAMNLSLTGLRVGIHTDYSAIHESVHPSLFFFE